MKKFIAAILLFVVIPMHLWAAEGVVNVRSTFTVKETADRMENILKNKGMTVFNRIKHSEAAGKIGIGIPDTELIIFGNPKVGSPLMKCQQSIAIDLPQKALVWANEKDEVWISYNNPRYLEKRHAVSGCEKVIAKVEKVLAGISKAAAND
ncbi:MAG: hypothetical protein [Olavius algarvensis Delta 4 endosymbiont]|nr:MAG: hypothetical protein [Olavius algarvensis Delta 4 endosymbiont]